MEGQVRVMILNGAMLACIREVSTLYRALVGQGPSSGPGWLAIAIGFWSRRALATGYWNG